MSLNFLQTNDVTSWGRVVRQPQMVASPVFRSELTSWARQDTGRRLAIGLRRSYGDSGLYSAGRLILMPALDRLISFDPATGILRAQSGLSLSALLQFCVPLGWFVPVTPGTRNVTLGGAVANDVHGKNHSSAGTFTRHVKAITLLRSDSGLLALSPEDASGMFAATCGGMGLTGVILDVTLQLVPIRSAFLDVETFPLGNLNDFFALNEASLGKFEQTVAWIDCTEKNEKIGLGVYSRANWATQGGLVPHKTKTRKVPFEAPGFALNPVSLAIFNKLYRRAQLAKPQQSRAHYAAFFHPLDALQEWNKLYGPAGFFQYQCVVPAQPARDALHEMLRLIAKSGEGSALIVLKTFGDIASPGMLSFPRPGYTLALDFKNRGALTTTLLASLDAVVRQAGGALYPAKDGRMPADMFELSYPAWPQFSALRDPACGSDFITRIGYG